jgi:hypothetical protein
MLTYSLSPTLSCLRRERVGDGEVQHHRALPRPGASWRDIRLSRAKTYYDIIDG